MQYQVRLKDPKDFTNEDYVSGNALCEIRFGNIKYGIWFDTLEEAKEVCIKHGAYGIIDYDNGDYVWKNPNYKSKTDRSIEGLRKYLGEILLPH